jgi:hypothetical protein
MAEQEMPEGWKTIKIGDILTVKQIKEVKNYLLSKDATTEGLKEILKKHEKELLEKGVLPDYLAYYLWYALKTRYGEKLKEVLR